jgi:hypothetical protein
MITQTYALHTNRDLSFLQNGYFNNTIRHTHSTGASEFQNRPSPLQFPHLESLDLRLFELPPRQNDRARESINGLHQILQACSLIGPRLRYVSGFVWTIRDMQKVMDAVLTTATDGPSDAMLMTVKKEDVLTVIANSKDTVDNRDIIKTVPMADWVRMDMDKVLKVFGRFKCLIPSIVSHESKFPAQLPKIVNFLLSDAHRAQELDLAVLLKLLSKVMDVYYEYKTLGEGIQDMLIKVVSAMKKRSEIEFSADAIFGAHKLLDRYLIETTNRSPVIIGMNFSVVHLATIVAF